MLLQQVLKLEQQSATFLWKQLKSLLYLDRAMGDVWTQNLGVLQFFWRNILHILSYGAMVRPRLPDELPFYLDPRRLHQPLRHGRTHILFEDQWWGTSLMQGCADDQEKQTRRRLQRIMMELTNDDWWMRTASSSHNDAMQRRKEKKGLWPVRKCRVHHNNKCNWPTCWRRQQSIEKTSHRSLRKEKK